MATLEKGQSQLDWLWVNYSEIDPTDIALQSEIEEQIDVALQNAVNTIEWNQPSNTQGQILGYNKDGELITTATIDLPVYIFSTELRDSTSEDSDYDLNTPLLSFTLSDGSKITVDMSQFVYTVKSSSTIAMDLTDNVIYSELKFGTQDNAVVLQKTSNGVVAELNIAEDTEIDFDTENGLKGTIPLQNTDYTVKFSALTMAQYLEITPVDGTIYFIYDQPCIYLNGVQYTIASDEVNEIVQSYLTWYDV